MTLDDDPRWRRLHGRGTPCACCGRVFTGVMDMGYDHPDAWPHGNRRKADVEVLRAGDDSLDSDFCSLGEHRFIRAILPLPIIGSDTVFSYGPWGSVNPANHDAWRRADPDFEGCFAWLANKLPGTGMEDWLPCDLIPDADPSKRPTLHVHDGHPLADWQENGITFDQLLDIYAAAGQDIRPHLLDA